MKLTRKLVLALLSGFVVILLASGVLRVRREAQLFERDMARDHDVLGRALAKAVVRVADRDGLAAAEAVVAGSEGPVRVRVVHAGEPLPANVAAALARGQEASERRDSDDGIGRLFTWVPVGVGDPADVRGRLGGITALELSESLRDQHTYLRQTVRTVGYWTAVLVACSAVIAAVLGELMISRPIRQLLEKIRQVSEGELEAVVKLPQQDELGEIGRALNRMSDGIAASQRRIEAESQARVAAVEQLRHAERLMTVGKLASGLAHELGTPLNVVFGRAELTMLDERASADARDNARIIRDQTQRMIVIIRQLLDFARKKPPHKRRADVAAIARQAVDLLQPIAQKRGVRLDVEAGGEPAAIAIDEGQIMQVTTNLLQNAIQATADGGHVAVRVGWVDARPPADADGARAGRHVALTVEDDGCGMAPDTLARIFEPFFTTKEVGQGTGLGLSVAYGIVREHGGWIAVESAAGKGSTFRVHLPGVAVAATEPNDAGVAAQEGRA